MKQAKGNPIIVFTDLDGSLLDHHTYSYQEASQALERLQEERIPLILNSSKTRVETNRLWEQLKLTGPFIFENGGGIVFPKGYPYGYPVGLNSKTRVWPLGRNYQELITLIRWLKKDHSLPITGFSDMSVDDLVQVTGLDPVVAKEAKKREFSEPFLFEGPQAAFHIFLSEIKKRGLQVTQGGRFYHLSGRHDKGTAIKKMMRWLRTGHRVRPVTIGIGDSPNDFPMLKVCDWPVLIRRADGSHAQFSIPNLYRTQEIGPQGWQEGISHFLDLLKN